MCIFVRMKRSSLLQVAIQQFGSQSALASAIGFSQHAVWHALQRGSVSPRMAVAIEKATKGAVTKVQLCPDVFGDA
jgi:DNA-binding transcriptional regulator YdaS (Cro superfamily)